MTARAKTQEPKTKRRKVKAPPTSGVGLPVARLLKSLQRRRHRVAVLEALAGQGISMFTSATSHEPEWVIGDREGSLERALEDVVFEVCGELRALAEKERAAIAGILNQDVTTITLSAPPLPADEDGDEEAEERVLDKAILNVTMPPKSA